MVDRLLYALLLLIVLSDLGAWEDCECSLLHFLIYFIVQSSPICVRLTATSTTNGVSFNRGVSHFVSVHVCLDIGLDIRLGVRSDS